MAKKNAKEAKQKAERKKAERKEARAKLGETRQTLEDKKKLKGRGGPGRTATPTVRTRTGVK
jgi:hypothetical protein